MYNDFLIRLKEVDDDVITEMINMLCTYQY